MAHRFGLQPSVKETNRYEHYVTAKILFAIVFGLCVTRNAQDVQVFTKLGAVAGKCGDFAVDIGATFSYGSTSCHPQKTLSLSCHNEEYMKELNESGAFVYNPSWLLQFALISAQEPQSSRFNN